VNDVDTRTFNILSLCTGGGGLDLGVKLAVPAARIVCCVEHEAYCCEILASRMETQALDEAPVWTDIHTFDGKPWRGVVDCIIAGYPCTPFSQAGQRKGEADPRHLWPEIARIVGEIEPGLLFFENVAGHLSLGADTVFAEIERMGYEIAAGLFTAAEVGASHRRERLFILARRCCAGRGEQEPGRGSQGRTAARGAGGKLADTTRIRQLRPNREGGRGGRRTVGASEHMEHPCRGGSGKPNAKQAGDRKGLSRDIVRASRDVADASSERRKERGRTGISENEEGRITTRPALNRDCGIPIFPPGPGGIEAWREVLEIDPALEPALRKLADGASDRVGELRLLGNAVVPLQAAYAFVSLAACLWHGD